MPLPIRVEYNELPSATNTDFWTEMTNHGLTAVDIFVGHPHSAWAHVSTGVFGRAATALLATFGRELGGVDRPFEYDRA